MGQTILLQVVSYCVTLLLGVLVGAITKFFKKDKEQQKTLELHTEALKCLTRSTLTTQYYVYKEIGSVPKNIKENWYLLYEAYIGMGGNSFVTTDIKPKWDILDIE